MRIISGTHKGRRISAPRRLPVRPTTDMAKEALFNILHNTYFFEELVVLDLYSGTGNISYELASRGCKAITAVDSNYQCIQFIKKTSHALGFPISGIKNEAIEYLEKTTQTFDLIFADPPYNQAPEAFKKLHDLVFQRNLLRKDGVLIIEHSKHTELSELEYFEQQRKYGGSIFSFFRQHPVN
jgi:16S rRNA (guanine(966)-N(2))-methyltransferase RsmD